MSIFRFVIIAVIFFVICCNSKPTAKKEPWIETPVVKWPDFVLTNEIAFKDTTFRGLANAFLINTYFDTLGRSTKAF